MTGQYCQPWMGNCEGYREEPLFYDMECGAKTCSVYLQVQEWFLQAECPIRPLRTFAVCARRNSLRCPGFPYGGPSDERRKEGESDKSHVCRRTNGRSFGWREERVEKLYAAVKVVYARTYERVHALLSLPVFESYRTMLGVTQNFNS